MQLSPSLGRSPRTLLAKEVGWAGTAMEKFRAQLKLIDLPDDPATWSMDDVQQSVCICNLHANDSKVATTKRVWAAHGRI